MKLSSVIGPHVFLVVYGLFEQALSRQGAEMANDFISIPKAANGHNLGSAGKPVEAEGVGPTLNFHPNRQMGLANNIPDSQNSIAESQLRRRIPFPLYSNAYGKPTPFQSPALESLIH